MTIGIGITTYGNRGTLQVCLENIKKNSDLYNTVFHVATDTDENRLGIARRKNQNLSALANCDYIFLFDDDCYPVDPFWAKEIIAASNHGLGEHFQLNNPIKHGKPQLQFINGAVLESYSHGGAPLMFMTKKAVETVGGFYPGYGTYGFEHIGWSTRAFKAGLSHGIFTGPPVMQKLFCALDYENADHPSSISKKEKDQLTELAISAYPEDIKEIYRPIEWQK